MLRIICHGKEPHRALSFMNGSEHEYGPPVSFSLLSHLCCCPPQPTSIARWSFCIIARFHPSKQQQNSLYLFHAWLLLASMSAILYPMISSLGTLHHCSFLLRWIRTNHSYRLRSRRPASVLYAVPMPGTSTHQHPTFEEVCISSTLRHAAM